MGKWATKDFVSSQGWAWLHRFMPPHLISTSIRFWFTGASFALLLGIAWAAVATNYVYDSKGRLIVVTNEAGESARYRYDKLGNLIEIDRLQPGDLVIFDVSPGRGATGTQIRITGLGFSTTPAQNDVRFNGTTAIVSTVSATELIAQVPLGATTGPITVAVGPKTASSPSDFVVDAHIGPPVIGSMDPLIVRSGTLVNVTGQRLYPIQGQTKVSIHGRSALPTTATNYALSFQTPTKAGSGQVTVSTPFGRAISEQYLIVVPNGIDPANVISLSKLAINAPARSISTASSSQFVALLIEGEANFMGSLQFSELSGPVIYEIYGPTNSLIADGVVSATSPTVHLPRLAASPYLLLLQSYGAPGSWRLGLERNNLAIDAPSVTISSSAVNQSKRLALAATQGDSLRLSIDELSMSGAAAFAEISVYTPSGASSGQVKCYVTNLGCKLNFPNLAAGAYTLIVKPPSNTTMAFKAALLTGANNNLLVNGSAIGAVSSSFGQELSFTFQASQGQNLSAGFIDLSMPGARNDPGPDPSVATLYVYGPGGGLMATRSCFVLIGACPVSLSNMAAGTYTLRIKPSLDGNGMMSLQALISPDVTGTLPRSVFTSVTIPRRGQYGRLTFSGNAREKLKLTVKDPVSAPPAYINYTVYQPGGGVLASMTASQGEAEKILTLPSLPVTGNYTVFIEPGWGQILTVQMRIAK